MARITSKQLSGLCLRVGLALESGIEERKIWFREVQRASGSLGTALQRVQESIEAGNSVSEGAALSGRYFPPLFQELVLMGEQTGKSGA
ncbi:MAG: hypothetical protein N2C12_14905, partial [Planctomycetales bacterium]